MRPSCNIHSPAVIAVAWLLHTAASFNISLSPAATEVLGSDLLPEETLQLTNAALESAISEVVPDVPGQLVNNGSLALVNTFSFATNTSSSSSSSSQCKTYTGDSLWPDEQLWKLFNGLLGDNALLEVPPIASPCYTNWDNYDAETCDFISDNFTDSHLHAGHPSSIMSPFYEGATCMYVFFLLLFHISPVRSHLQKGIPKSPVNIIFKNESVILNILFELSIYIYI